MSTETSIHNLLTSEGQLFKKILGEQWSMLDPAIQQRFEKVALAQRPLKYAGTLSMLSASFWGKVLGHITRPLIKGALIPYTDFDVAVDIQVYANESGSRIYKERTYRLNHRKPIVFTSYLQEGEQGEALEYVGMGLGMKLLVFEKNSNLHFESDGYFWDMGFARIPLPDILSPGKTYLQHNNEGEHQFSIRIDIHHKWFGRMFSQAGVFTEI